MSILHRIAMLLSLVFWNGCVAIHSDISQVDYLEERQHVDRVVDGSRKYHVSAEVLGTNLLINLSKTDRCEKSSIPIFRRKRVITRTAVPSLFGIQEAWLAGALAMASGGVLVESPQRWCPDGEQNHSNGIADMCRLSGWALVGLGAVITTAALIDSIRVIDEEQNLGVYKGKYTSFYQRCREGPVANTSVLLALNGNRVYLHGRTSPLGDVMFSMIDVDDSALPSPLMPAGIVVAGTSLPITITGPQSNALVRSLLDAPQSKTARNAAALAALNCQREVDSANRGSVTASSSDSMVADVLDAWSRAKEKCAAHWTHVHERQREVIAKAIEDNRIGALLVALNTRNLDRIEEVLAQTPTVVSRLREDLDVARPLRTMVAEPSMSLVLKRQAGTDQLRRLCRARQVYVKIFGSNRWDQLKLEIAQNLSDIGGGPRANIVRLMDSAPCI